MADIKKTVTRSQAEEAIRTILNWIGEDVHREGLKDTPRRVIDSYDEFFGGYKENPEEVLKVTFEEISGYREMIILRDIKFQSTCEHHMAPIIGYVNIAYVPNERVVGISKLARVVEIFAKRLQLQERLTEDIAKSIYNALGAKGVAVTVDAEHHCITTRGINNSTSRMRTYSFHGCMNLSDKATQAFLSL